MAKIKSTRTAIINAEEQILGTILIELNSPIHDVLSGSIRCNINYFHQEESRQLFSRTWVLPVEKATLLLEACINDTESIDDLLSGFLLEKLQANSAYGILPEEWIISNDALENKTRNNEKENENILIK